MPSNALVLRDPPAPAKTTKEQDMIDFLSLALTTTSTSPDVPQTPPATAQKHEAPPLSSSQESTTSQMYGGSPGQAYNSYDRNHGQSYNNYGGSQGQAYSNYGGNQGLAYNNYGGNQGQVYNNYGGNQGMATNNYVVPWARPQVQQQPQMQYPAQSTNYPPPPWVEASGYPNNNQHNMHPNASYSNQNNLPTNNTSAFAQGSTASPHTTMPALRSLENTNSFPTRGMVGSSNAATSPRTTTQAPQKTFIPSYRLFEDLNVLGNADGRLKANGSSTSLSGSSGQGMVGGRK